MAHFDEENAAFDCATAVSNCVSPATVEKLAGARAFSSAQAGLAATAPAATAHSMAKANINASCAALEDLRRQDIMPHRLLSQEPRLRLQEP